MRGPRAALVLALLTATLIAQLPNSPGTRRAYADSETRLRLDRAVAEPAYFPGYVRLRLYATAVTLQGGFIPLTGKKAFSLTINGAKKTTPYLMGAFAGTDEPLAIAIVIHRGFEYAENWTEIKAAFKPFLESLPNDTQVSLISYADSVETSRFTSPSSVQKDLDALDTESSPSDNDLIKAVERAVRLLDRVKLKQPISTARKFIILLSDGKDLDPEPARFRKAGEKAAKKGIRIHSIAFSPEDNRRPLLGLGELSKRSVGTFRWVRGSGLFTSQFSALAAEVSKQYVLTFYVKPDLIKNKRVSLTAGDAESNALKVKIECGEETCGDDQYCAEARCITRRGQGAVGILGWILYILGGMIGVLLLLAVIGYILSRRGAKPMPMPGQMPGQMPGAAPAGADPAAARAAPGDPAAQGQAAPAPRPSQAIVAYDSQGRALGSPQAAAAAASPAPAQRGQPALYVINGPLAGNTVPVAHGTTIGTHPSCQLTLAGDGFASSVHAQILIDTAGNCSIIDKGSTNGTFVNGVRTQHRGLAHGNSIKIGGVELRFLLQ